MEQSPLQPTPVGAFRFNTDSSKMEYYDGTQWVNVTSTSPEAETGGTRGILWNGYNPNNRDDIEYINVDSAGNAIDFGNATVTSRQRTSCASRTRSLAAMGYADPGTYINTIDYITIATTGNAADFGDVSDARGGSPGGVADSTRGIWMGGTPSIVDTMEYNTIATLGNSVDFGNLVDNNSMPKGFGSSPTRGVLGGGSNPSLTNVIQYITISTTGNAADFGDTTNAVRSGGGCANAVRLVFAGGKPHPSAAVKFIDYVTMASLGNAIDFGDLVTPTASINGGSSSGTRAVFSGGYDASSTHLNQMQYIQIMTEGNSFDFGDMTAAKEQVSSCSNGHGGLG